MNPIALLGGGIAAVLGAAGWGLLTWATGWEIGYVAWAMGGLVGFGVAILGGKGPAMSAIAALLTALSIFGGKMLAIRLVAEKAQAQHVDEREQRQDYEQFREAATAFAKVASEDEHRQFMVDHGFTEADNAQAVADDELAEFREEIAPELARFSDEKTDFETWKNEQNAVRARFLNNPALLARIALNELGLIDGLFMLLGIGTAFRVVAAAENKKAVSSPPPGPAQQSPAA